MSEVSGVALGRVGVRRPAPVRAGGDASTGPPGWSASDDFDAFVAARGAALVRSARGLLRDPQHAEDVVQDVLVKVHRHWDTIVRQEVPDAYVRRMLVNACTSFWRRAARRERSVPDDSLTLVVDLRGPVPDESRRVDEREHMLSMLRRLPAKQRAVLVLRHYEGLPDAEVAAVMGTSVQTVRSNVHRGLATLRTLMTQHEEGQR
jgi:RNA polymerase sigma-70 factor (sigma-E family)